MSIYTASQSVRQFLPSLLVFVAILLSACSDGNDHIRSSTLGVPGADNANAVAVPAALVEGPVPGKPVLVGTFIDLPALGYTTETEYFLSGTASAYTNVNELGSDGKWQVEASEQAAYQTRIVVIRPADPADFNGTVFVEWLNVSAGFDSGPDWNMVHTELIRQGHAWVGVSAQKIGVDALLDGSAAAIIPGSASGSRYDSLFHPGDNYAYDIYSQVAQAIRAPGAASPLGNLQVQRLIAAGESQSAGRMVTYVNAFAPLHALFDGYFIHSRTEGSAGLQQDSFCDGEIPTPRIVRVREDLGIPVMMLQTETDLFILGSHSSNQDDSKNFRLWEIAGTAHADLYTFLDNRTDTGSNPAIAAIVEEAAPIPGIIECDIPVNAGPQHFVANAAVRALNTWIVEGVAPSGVDRLEVSGQPAAFVRDEFGNVKGGVRTPYVDVPIATLEGEGQPQPDLYEITDENCQISIATVDFCFLSGTTRKFDPAQLGSLYADNADYVDALNSATDEAVSKGFLLPEDAALIKANAANSDIFAP